MSSGLQSMSSWLVQVFLLLFPCYVNWEFERRVCRMEELRVCISVLTLRQWRRAWEGAASLPGAVLIKENSNCSWSICLQLFLAAPLSALKYKNELSFRMGCLSRAVFRKNLFYWAWFLLCGFYHCILPHFAYLKHSQLKLLELDWL